MGHATDGPPPPPVLHVVAVLGALPALLPLAPPPASETDADTGHRYVWEEAGKQRDLRWYLTVYLDSGSRTPYCRFSRGFMGIPLIDQSDRMEPRVYRKSTATGPRQLANFPSAYSHTRTRPIKVSL